MRTSILIAVLSGLAACGGGTDFKGPLACDSNGQCPLGLYCYNSYCYVIGADLGGLFGDGGGGDGGGPPVVCGGAMDAKNVADTYLMPMSKSEFAYDLNGDGKPDNQWGNIEGALTAQNIDTQSGVTAAVKNGQIVLLFDQSAADLAGSGCDQVQFAVGSQTASPPRFDGSDSFTVDSSLAPASFTGDAAGGAFSSAASATATADVTMMLPLPVGLFAGGGATTPVMLHGAHLQFTRSGDHLVKGQINGALKNTDVQTMVMPSVATLLNQRVQANPSSSTSQQLLSLFDTGGTPDPSNPSSCVTTRACHGQPAGSPACKNLAGPDAGSCADACDGVISTCEVASNSIIKNMLAPDVQMFAADGVTYLPNPSNTKKDSLSVGVGFTAVKAAF